MATTTAESRYRPVRFMKRVPSLTRHTLPQRRPSRRQSLPPMPPESRI
uniref:Uncharacterized protein n=1 Tax=Timema poppense TaxID=170557 RepID=A0A7R9DYA1_TIMPO|nr:unnamed protein product [Timema poppensis]